MKLFYFPNNITKENIDWYYLGVRQGLWAFAWMRDGTSYVGSGLKTLKQAYEDLYHEYRDICTALDHKAMAL